MTDLQATIEAAFEQRRELDPARPDPRLREAIEAAIAMLDAGTARVAEKIGRASCRERVLYTV